MRYAFSLTALVMSIAFWRDGYWTRSGHAGRRTELSSTGTGQIAKFFPIRGRCLCTRASLSPYSEAITARKRDQWQNGNSSSARSCGRSPFTPAHGAIPAHGRMPISISRARRAPLRPARSHFRRMCGVEYRLLTQGGHDPNNRSSDQILESAIVEAHVRECANLVGSNGGHYVSRLSSDQALPC